MAQEVVRADMPYRRWLRAVAFTVAMVLLVAFGVTDSINLRTAVVLVVVFGAAGAFLWMFPGSRFFVLAFTNAMSVYTCIFFYLAQTNFAAVPVWVFSLGYALPAAAFIAGAWRSRAEIGAISAPRRAMVDRHPFRIFTWLLPVVALAAATHAVPRIGVAPEIASGLFLAAMAATAAFVAIVSRDVCVFLVDTGWLFDQFFVRMVRLFSPAFAFFTLYSINVIVFAMVYRIMDRMADAPLFMIDGVAERISYIDSLYFSVITVSTVGYGDIVPASDPVRVVASIEIVLGVILMLFGFYEIMNYARQPGDDDREDNPGV